LVLQQTQQPSISSGIECFVPRFSILMAAFDQDDYDEALQALEDHQRVDVAPAEWRLGHYSTACLILNRTIGKAPFTY
jgi:hypothetical protein